MGITSKKSIHYQLMIVIKGTLITIAGMLATCAITSYLILKEHIPESSITAAVLSILLFSSFLGTKYCNMKAGDKRYVVTFMSGITFILILMMVNLITPAGAYNDVLPKTASVMLGTVLGSVGMNRKRRGGGPLKHRHNR